MRTEINDDGSTSYTLTENEKFWITAFIFYVVGRGTGYRKGRTAMAKEISKTGMPRP